MPRKLASITLLAACVLFLAGFSISSRPAQAAGDVWGRDYLPDVPVVTQDGETLRFYSDVIKDKIVVISFIYTTCRDICPLVTARLADVAKNLGPAFGRDVYFVSVSIDPETDTPERMKQHAEAFDAKPGWLFLTGKKADIDVIRHKLGERSRKITEHRSEILFRNDRTGEWAKDSVFGDIATVTANIRALDPVLQAQDKGDAQTAATIVASDIGLPGQALFVRACAACHTIGKGDKVGPDLRGLSERRERQWIEAFLRSPQGMRNRGDATAKALAEKFQNVRMPELGLAKNDISDLVSYIDARTHAAVLAEQDMAQAGAGHNHHDHSQHGGSNEHQGHGHHGHH